jgi:hypothetical protein
MDARAAVALAKKEISDLFADEGIQNLGLEEIEFDEAENAWTVTIGFVRPWGDAPSGLAALAGQAGHGTRDYKVVRIADARGHVISVRSHGAQV